MSVVSVLMFLSLSLDVQVLIAAVTSIVLGSWWEYMALKKDLERMDEDDS